MITASVMKGLNTVFDTYYFNDKKLLFRLHLDRYVISLRCLNSFRYSRKQTASLLFIFMYVQPY